jgi:hypothetical protein
MAGSNVVRYQAGILTVIVALITITPLCGLLFDCGCTWPWSGLESHCNIHDSKAVHQCPWCVSIVAGVLSVGLAVLVGYLLALKPADTGSDMRGSALADGHQESSLSEISKRFFVGMLGFVSVAVVTGWLSGMIQSYPYFVLINEWPF